MVPLTVTLNSLPLRVPRFCLSPGYGRIQTEYGMPSLYLPAPEALLPTMLNVVQVLNVVQAVCSVG